MERSLKKAKVAGKRKLVKDKVLRALKPEFDFKDTAMSSAAVSTTPVAFGPLNALSQGAAASDRVGRKIQVRSIEMRGYLYGDSAAVVNHVRLVVVQDKQANGAAPSWTDIYDSNLYYSLRNLAKKQRFKILWDKTYTLVGNSSAPQDTTSKHVQMYKKVNIQTDYNSGNAGTVADIDKNSIYVFAIALAGSGTGDMQWNGTARIRYTDI